MLILNPTTFLSPLISFRCLLSSCRGNHMWASFVYIWSPPSQYILPNSYHLTSCLNTVLLWLLILVRSSVSPSKLSEILVQDLDQVTRAEPPGVGLRHWTFFNSAEISMNFTSAHSDITNDSLLQNQLIFLSCLLPFATWHGLSLLAFSFLLLEYYLIQNFLRISLFLVLLPSLLQGCILMLLCGTQIFDCDVSQDFHLFWAW